MTRYYRTKSGVITTWYNSLGILQRLDEKTGEIQEELAIDPEDKDATFCINGETILNEVRKQSGQDVIYIPQRERLAKYLEEEAKDGDLIITMGAGDIYKTGEELVELLNK